MKIVVLAGGLSPERNVSLSSGSKVCQTLRNRGHEVAFVDMYLGTDAAPESLFGAALPADLTKVARKAPNLEELKALPELQLAILNNQSTYVKKGGVLLYSTCTLLREENEGVAEQFLAQNNEFYTEPLPLPAVFPKNESGMLALVTGEYDTDGFFICRLRRKA